jgi:ribosomal protein S18 acetylase RimI-like enzyme
MIAIHYRELTPADADAIRNAFGAQGLEHTRFAPDVTWGAFATARLVGFISTYTRQLPAPFADTVEGYINIIEVHPDFRRRGIGATLVRMTLARAPARGWYQLRAWSSDDKVLALHMWRVLGFSLCPATVYPRGRAVSGYFATHTCEST